MYTLYIMCLAICVYIYTRVYIHTRVYMYTYIHKQLGSTLFLSESFWLIDCSESPATISRWLCICFLKSLAQTSV